MRGARRVVVVTAVFVALMSTACARPLKPVTQPSPLPTVPSLSIPRVQMVSVPDLTKFVHPPRCNTELKRLGLTLEVLEVVRGSRDPSTPQVLVVRRQSPRAGTKVPRGSSVKVWVVVAEPRPSFA